MKIGRCALGAWICHTNHKEVAHHSGKETSFLGFGHPEDLCPGTDQAGTVSLVWTWPTRIGGPTGKGRPGVTARQSSFLEDARMVLVWEFQALPFKDSERQTTYL
jgi:hypothetical protein